MANLHFYGPWADPLFKDVELVEELARIYPHVNVGAVANPNVDDKQAISHIKNVRVNITTARALARALPYRSVEVIRAALEVFAGVDLEIKRELVDLLPLAVLEKTVDSIDDSHPFYEILTRRAQYHLINSTEISVARFEYLDNLVKEMNTGVAALSLDTVATYVDLLRVCDLEDNLVALPRILSNLNGLNDRFLPVLLRISWLNPRIQKAWFASQHLSFKIAMMSYASIDLEDKRRFLSALEDDSSSYALALKLLSADPRFEAENFEDELIHLHRFSIRKWSGENVNLSVRGVDLDDLLSEKGRWRRDDDNLAGVFLEAIHRSHMLSFDHLRTLNTDMLVDGVLTGSFNLEVGQLVENRRHFYSLADTHDLTKTAVGLLRAAQDKYTYTNNLRALLEAQSPFVELDQKSETKKKQVNTQECKRLRNLQRSPYNTFEKGFAKWGEVGNFHPEYGVYLHKDTPKIAKSLRCLEAWKAFTSAPRSRYNADIDNLLRSVPKELIGKKPQRLSAADEAPYTFVFGDALGDFSAA